MSWLVVIPARYASSRLPGKPLADIAGEPMIVRTWQRVAAEVPAEKIVVATDHPKIVAVCKERGMAVEVTSAECRTGTDRVAEVVFRRPGVDVAVNVQGDEGHGCPALWRIGH